MTAKRLSISWPLIGGNLNMLRKNVNKALTNCGTNNGLKISFYSLWWSFEKVELYLTEEEGGGIEFCSGHGQSHSYGKILKKLSETWQWKKDDMVTPDAEKVLFQYCPLPTSVLENSKVMIVSKNRWDSVLGFAWDMTVTNRWACSKWRWRKRGASSRQVPRTSLHMRVGVWEHGMCS